MISPPPPLIFLLDANICIAYRIAAKALAHYATGAR